MGEKVGPSNQRLPQSSEDTNTDQELTSIVKQYNLKRDKTDIPLIFETPYDKGQSQKAGGFTPDGVFSITHAERQKTLLFFLEVDMGTESMATMKREPREIRQKVINYQEYFRSDRYNRRQRQAQY